MAGKFARSKKAIFPALNLSSSSIQEDEALDDCSTKVIKPAWRFLGIKDHIWEVFRITMAKSYFSKV
jgi:hypothetical protein